MRVSFTALLALVVCGVFFGVLRMVINGIKRKNWKWVFLLTVGFLALAALGYCALLNFITSM